jgi:glycosyltransferase involved in cell wall biosynthesis
MGMKAYQGAGLKTSLVYAGVDDCRFRPAEGSEKADIRKRYGISSDVKVALHVGHIKERRNVRSLTELGSIPDVQIVLVGSSSTEQDRALADELKRSGVMILNSYIERIEEVYKMADVYVFPVVEPIGAIEMPLSVLEAMACNLPVVSTRFGGLVDCFEEGEGLFYTDGSGQLTEMAIKALQLNEVGTREKVQSMAWPIVIGNLLTEVMEIGH